MWLVAGKDASKVGGEHTHAGDPSGPSSTLQVLLLPRGPLLTLLTFLLLYCPVCNTNTTALYVTALYVMLVYVILAVLSIILLWQ